MGAVLSEVLQRMNKDDPIQSKNAEIILKMWYRHQRLLEKYLPYLKKREEFIRNLEKTIYSTISLQAQDFGSWRTKEFVSDDPDNRIFLDYAPQLHYKILNCEIVLDLETLNKENLKKCLSVLKTFNIKPIVAFSGNKGFHIHFFFTVENYPIHDFIWHPQASLVNEELRRFFLDFLNDKGVRDIDPQVRHPHWIRALWSLNVKEKIGLKRPLNSGEISVWSIPTALMDTLKKARKLREIREELLKEEYDAETKYNVETRQQKSYDRDAIEEVFKVLEPYKAKEFSTYILYHCPFHPPDKNPSFTFWKKAGLFKDWHDGKVYHPNQLIKALRRRET